MIQKIQHQHKFEPVEPKKVLLRKYRVEEGRMRYQLTTGYDLLKQRACKCGKIETFDLERTLV